MNTKRKTFTPLLLAAAAALSLHIIIQQALFSLFLFPLIIGCLFAFMGIASITLFLLTAIVLELFSSLPVGSSALVFTLPYITNYAFPYALRSTKAQLALKVGITVALQLMALVAIQGLVHISLIVGVWLFTSTFVYISIVIWHARYEHAT